MRVVVLGATSGIAVACLKRWAPQAGEIVLVGRDEASLRGVAADLGVRSPRATVEVVVGDLGTIDGVTTAVEEAFAEPADLALIAFGTMPTQSEADASPQVAGTILELNGSMNLLAAHLVTQRMLAVGRGRLGVIGSVAGDRGRQSNYLYGAAKSMVATGVGGLQHRTHGTAVSISLIKPGPTDTAMTAHLRGGSMKLAPVDDVAELIVSGMEQNKPVIYAPKKWRLIMAIIRSVPRALFERTKL